MAERTIYITTKDLQRLRHLPQMTEARDRYDLADLQDELARAEAVPPEKIPPDVVTMNSRVRLLDLDKGKTHEYTLVYPMDADAAAGKVSIVAPTSISPPRRRR